MPQVDTLTRSQFEQSLQKMQSQREALLELIRPLSNDMRSWKPHKRERNIHELLMQIGTSECWFASKLGKQIPAPSEVTMMHYLFRSREIVLSRLLELSDSQLNAAFDDGWDVARVLEKILAEERQTIEQIQEIMVRWRLDLQARLAAERAGLFTVLLGFSPTQLAEVEPMAGWTIKDLLAHIAFWDGFHTNRMQMVVDGRIAEISEIGDDKDMDALNAKLLAEQKELPLEQSFAMLAKERGGFLQLLNRLSDAELQRQIRLPWGWRTHMREWAKWRYLHDASHAKQIRKWRAKLKPEEKRSDGPVDLLKALLRASRKEFVALLPLIPEDEWSTRPVCGVWTMKDLIGHLAAWTTVGVSGMTQVMAGESPTFVLIPDFEAWNQTEAGKRADLPWETVWQEYEESYQALLSGLDSLSPEQLGFEFHTPWGSKTSLSRWLTIWPLHEREHAVDVRQSLKLFRWPRRLTEQPEK